MTSKPVRLSMSRYTLGIQYPKALYLDHSPELEGKATPALLVNTDQDNGLGILLSFGKLRNYIHV